MIVEISKGYQISVPASIRKKYNLEAGDKLELEDQDGKLLVTLPQEESWQEIWDEIDKTATEHQLTPEELDDFSDLL